MEARKLEAQSLLITKLPLALLCNKTWSINVKFWF